MSLKVYREKRDFRKTLEPRPRKPSEGGKNDLRFVIQKHQASRLHYDFRLENEGVLKSWAVPKGISTDPTVKRLCIQTEDHPIDYKDFEGVIPEGNYGAGHVIIWDEGTYSCENGSEPLEKFVSGSLHKGHLLFTLNGGKLKGKFNLVKLHRQGNEWLLIKARDSFAGGEAMDETSIRSGRRVEDMKAPPKKKYDGRVRQELREAVRTPMPSVPPMLATLVDGPFDHPDWIFEVKWDGYRSLAEIKRGRVRLYSRNDKDQTEQFPEIAEALQGCGDALFDGEIVVLDPGGRPDFQLLQNYRRSKKGLLAYYVFDLLYLDGRDLRALPLLKRKEILGEVVPRSQKIRLSEYIKEKGKAFFRAAETNGLEGIMAKEIHSPYQSGLRSRDWLKIKIEKRQEVVIAGFTKPRAGRRYLGALVIGVYEGPDLVYAGHVGGGFDEETLRRVHEKLSPLISEACPFRTKPKTNMPVTWVRPCMICEVKFKEWTQEGQLRMPVFLGLRDDKSAQDVHRETTQDAEKISQKEVPHSNLDKVFWPKEGFTKGDVIEYYDKVSKWMLPYLWDRPQSLNRHPNGIDQENFFQKDISTSVPGYVHTIKIFSENDQKETNYLVCRNKKTLLYAANLGCIEMNVWNSRTVHLKNPDYMVLDFDPVEIDFSKVIEIVLATRELLDEIGLKGLCKTSGARGMHVYVPLDASLTHEQVKNFARLLFMVVRSRFPDIISLERDPARRRKKIYLDYLQNREGATMAAPYSLRPRSGAPVSMPLPWAEVRRGLDPLEFNIRTAIRRLDREGDVWQDGFKETGDLPKSLPILEKLLKKRT